MPRAYTGSYLMLPRFEKYWLLLRAYGLKMGSKSLTDSSTDIRTMFERSQERLLVWPPGLRCMESPALRMCARTLSSASRWFILTGNNRRNGCC